MANTKSARKQTRVSGRKRLRTKAVRSLCKTDVTKAEKVIFSGDIESAQKEVVAAITALDKAAEKKIIHPNNAARRKSRLMKKLNNIRTSAAPKGGTPAAA